MAQCVSSPQKTNSGAAYVLGMEKNVTRAVSFCYFFSEDAFISFAIWQVSKQISISFSIL